MGLIENARSKISGLKLNEKRYFLAMNIGVIFALTAHICFTALFAYYQVPFMVIFNILSVLVYGICMYLVYQYKAYFVGMILAGIEVPLHQVLAILFLGTGSGFQYYLLIMLVIPFFFPAKYNWLRMGVALISLAVFIFSQTYLSQLAPWTPQNPDLLQIVHFLNLGASLLVIVFLSFSSNKSVENAHDRLEEEHQRAEDLLHHILPKTIAHRLKQNDATIADGFESVSVLFSDIVGFTDIAAGLPPERVVQLLNKLFSSFDQLSEHYGLEKIKTIGDSYMVAAGVPIQQKNHGRLIGDFALDMLKALAQFNSENNCSFAMRIGINSGPVVAGVIGTHKFIYDLWGDTVNMASRMESTGLPGEIQVTEESYQLLKDDFDLEPRSCVEVKGRGCIDTWLLKGKLSPTTKHTV